MADSIRWGILSTARIAQTAFIPSLRTVDRGALVAVASRDAAQARAFADEHDIPEAVTGYEALLARDDIDAIYNPLPNSLHAEWTRAAAAAGKHVFCEKPLGVSAAEAQGMVEACRAAGVQLFEAFVFLAHPLNDRVRQVLDGGDIGDLVQTDVTFTFPLQRPTDNIRMNRELGGGSLMDVGCYPIAYTRFLFGEEPHSVQAALTMDPDYGVDTRASIVLGFSGERHAILQAGFDAPGGQQARVHGSTGWLEIGQPCHPQPQDHFVVHAGAEARRVDVEAGVPPFAPALEHVHDCLLAGATSRLPGEHAIGNLRVIEAVRESAATGRRVTLPVSGPGVIL